MKDFLKTILVIVLIMLSLGALALATDPIKGHTDIYSEVTALRSQVEALQKSTDECAAGVRYFGRLEELTGEVGPWKK